VTRSRPSEYGRRPLGGDNPPDASVRRGVPAQRPALSKSAGLATIYFHDWMQCAARAIMRRGRRNRRAPGRGVRGEARLRRTLAFGVDGLPSGGRRSPDRRQFRRQSSALLPPSSKRLSGFIWVICGHMEWMGGLCVFVFVTSAMALCPDSVSLCLCGFPGVEIESPRGFLKTHPGRSVAVRPGVAARRPTHGIGLCG